MQKLSTFTLNNQHVNVRYVETQTVKEGVECDIYEFIDDTTRDLAVVRVSKGYKTPLQLILKGDKTFERYESGKGYLTITMPDGTTTIYHFPQGEAKEAMVEIGQTMQWSADEDLVFSEICEPPYEDGRFKNL
jgi:hypothetical protein